MEPEGDNGAVGVDAAPPVDQGKEPTPLTDTGATEIHDDANKREAETEASLSAPPMKKRLVEVDGGEGTNAEIVHVDTSNADASKYEVKTDGQVEEGDSKPTEVTPEPAAVGTSSRLRARTTKTDYSPKKRAKSSAKSPNGSNTPGSGRKKKEKKLHPDSGKRYGLGAPNVICDVCFLEEDKEIGETPFIKCIYCGLIAHTACYPPITTVDPNGGFLCDPCATQFQPSTNRGHRSKRSDGSNIASPKPLAEDAEAKCDGRLYQDAGVKNLDVFCQLCTRRDVRGGMKPTDTKAWVHLACLMAAPDAYFGEPCATMVDGALKKNKAELAKFKKVTGKKALCEACGGESGMLLRCKHESAAGTPCDIFIHALCAEILDRHRVVKNVKGRDILSYKCTEHSYVGLDACGACKLGTKQNEMLECDKCGQGYHMGCLDPPMEEVPEGDWYCEPCLNPAPPEPVKADSEPAETEKKESDLIEQGAKPTTESDGADADVTPDADEKPEEKKEEEGAPASNVENGTTAGETPKPDVAVGVDGNGDVAMVDA